MKIHFRFCLNVNRPWPNHSTIDKSQTLDWTSLEKLFLIYLAGTACIVLKKLHKIGLKWFTFILRIIFFSPSFIQPRFRLDREQEQEKEQERERDREILCSNAWSIDRGKCCSLKRMLRWEYESRTIREQENLLLIRWIFSPKTFLRIGSEESKWATNHF